MKLGSSVGPELGDGGENDLGRQDQPYLSALLHLQVSLFRVILPWPGHTPW